MVTLASLIALHSKDNNPNTDPVSGKITPPTSLKDAQSRSDWALWKYVVDKEMASFVIDLSASPELKRLLGNDPDANVIYQKHTEIGKTGFGGPRSARYP